MTPMNVTYDFTDIVADTYDRAEEYLHSGEYTRGDTDTMSYDDFGYLDYIELMS